MSQSLPHGKLRCGDKLSAKPDCAAPFHSSGDILISSERHFVGFSYEIHVDHDWALELVRSAFDQSVRYVRRDSEYTKSVYGSSNVDYVEFIICDHKISAVLTALSNDGFWYLDDTGRKLLAFGISDIDCLLEEHDLIEGEIRSIPTIDLEWEA